jgi:hypothetical protein
MDLHFKYHPSNHEIYLSPLTPHQNSWHADAMVKHFNNSTGIFSKYELEKFKIFVELHGHTLIIDN